MKVEQNVWQDGKWVSEPIGKLGGTAQLVLIFGGTAELKDKKKLDQIKAAYPQAHLLGCSTAGEILGARVMDDTLAVTAISFEKTTVRGVRVKMADVKDSREAGARLAGSLAKDGLAHVFVLSDGLVVNGSELARGLSENLPAGVAITGGLSGDGANFKETYVLYDSQPETKVIAALGFYGRNIKVGYGSLGGWDPFGPYRLVTRAKGNILFELDGKSALELYKKYLGDQAKGLPATGLLYPLEVRGKEGETPVVRTILAVNEAEQSMTFAGDVPEGAQARLMKANFDRLVDGALGAARTSQTALGELKAELAILISCVGRKLVLAQRTEEEVDAVRQVLGGQAALTGFYSYGEIAPFVASGKCELHNQTMTITAFKEV
jgi:hypothetical protein